MSDFESQFDDGARYSRLMPNDDFDRLAFLNERIDDIDGVVDLRILDRAILEDDQAQIQAIIRRLDALRDRLMNKRRPIDAEISRIAQQNRTDKFTQEAYERERARLLQELAARELFLAQSNSLLDATKDFPWQVEIGRAHV